MVDFKQPGFEVFIKKDIETYDVEASAIRLFQNAYVTIFFLAVSRTNLMTSIGTITSSDLSKAATFVLSELKSALLQLLSELLFPLMSPPHV